jgi:hypothetical protein
VIHHKGAGFGLVWQGNTKILVNRSNPDKELVQVISDRMLVVVPKSVKRASRTLRYHALMPFAALMCMIVIECKTLVIQVLLRRTSHFRKYVLDFVVVSVLVSDSSWNVHVALCVQLVRDQSISESAVSSTSSLIIRFFLRKSWSRRLCM